MEELRVLWIDCLTIFSDKSTKDLFHFYFGFIRFFHNLCFPNYENLSLLKLLWYNPDIFRKVESYSHTHKRVHVDFRTSLYFCLTLAVLVILLGFYRI
nr:MAG TPA: hypothetical protein [Caudoviricetes sp.]